LMGVFTLPPLPKLESRLPFEFIRTSAKSCLLPFHALPASRILLSVWTITLETSSTLQAYEGGLVVQASPTRIITLPSESKLVSRLPFVLDRSAGKSPM